MSLLPLFALSLAAVAPSRAAAPPAAVAREASAMQEDAPPIEWERDLAAGQERARAEQKPLLLVFRCER